jgi:beta-glucosidase
MKIKRLKKFALLCIFAAAIFTIYGSRMYKGAKQDNDQDLKIKTRVEDLLNKMTLQEKLDMLGGTGFATKPIKRLGIPEIKMSDGPLGVRWEKSTAFPAGICMASTWDTSLINKVGKSIGEELKAKGRNVILGPCVNIARIPMGGRNFESYGEDPYLDSRIAVSYIKGAQSEGVAATVKHFAVNNQEYERMFVNVKIDERALNEIYLPAFKAAVTEAKVLCVMAAYNKVNGYYCSENNYLLNKKLKDEWGFKGLVMSDWGAVHSSIPTAQNGLDLEMPKGEFLNPKTLTDAVKSGEVDTTSINDKVRRILTVMFKLGLFNHTISPDSNLINTKEHQEVAYKAAVEGIVLLKNDHNALPLNFKKIKSIAVIGPNSAIARTGGGGSSMVSPVYSVSPLEAFKKNLPKNIKINYAQGVKLNGDASPIEANYFYQPGKNSNQNGLLAEYFTNKNLEGKPAITKIDKQINFDWGAGSPFPNFPDDNFSVRWTGELKAPEAGDFLLDVVSDDGVRLYIDDSLVINDWNDHAAQSNTYKIHFGENQSHTFKLEYYENGGDALAEVSWRNPNNKLIGNAEEIAKNSDAVILFVGTSSNYESEGFDRPNLDLPNDQNDLINKVAAVNKNVIVVVTSGSPVLMNNWINNVNAVVENWFGGDEIGNAIVDILTGKQNPSGKLPITFPKRWEDCSAFGSYHKQDSVSVYSDGIFVGYRHFDKDNIAPLFPFGYGLSYTTFSYKNIKVREVGEKFIVSFEIKNTGSVKGAEVSQLYIHDVNPTIEKAPKELKKFSRVLLNPGEVKKIQFELSKRDFQYFDPNKHEWQVSPGVYEVMIGSSSRNIKLTGKISLE